MIKCHRAGDLIVIVDQANACQVTLPSRGVQKDVCRFLMREMGIFQAKAKDENGIVVELFEKDTLLREGKTHAEGSANSA